MPWSDLPYTPRPRSDRTIMTMCLRQTAQRPSYSELHAQIYVPGVGWWHQSWPLSDELLTASQLPEVIASLQVRLGDAVVRLAGVQGRLWADESPGGAAPDPASPPG